MNQIQMTELMLKPPRLQLQHVDIGFAICVSKTIEILSIQKLTKSMVTYGKQANTHAQFALAFAYAAAAHDRSKRSRTKCTSS